MSKKAVERPTRRKVEQPAVDCSIQAKSGPPQFLIDAAQATNLLQYDRAIACLKQGVSQDRFAACKGLGDMYLLLGQYRKAIEWLEKAGECKPEAASVTGGIDRALAEIGCEKEALEGFISVVEQQKDLASVCVLLESMQHTDLTEESIETLERAIDAYPQCPEIMFELAWFFERIGRFPKAETWYKKNAALTQNYKAFNQLGLICRNMGRISEAIEYMNKAVTVNPEFGGGWDNLVVFLMDAGHIQQGIELSRTIVDRIPNNSRFHSNFLCRLHYAEDLNARDIFEAHKKWGQRYAPISMARVSHCNTVEPERRLRIGYISPDFREHVAACYISVILDSHNRDVVEVYGYGNVQRPDDFTSSLRNKFDQYRDIWNQSDEAVARIIEQDKIDILVELAGHTKNNSLRALAYKPAPVQVTYLGYDDTTGMEAIDYLLADNMVTPPESQPFYTEKLFPLPKCIFCYQPLEEAPAVNPLPAAQKGYITFGAFVSAWRVNTRLLNAWAEILKLTPNSRLIMGFRGGDDMGLQHRFLSHFAQCGISRERIEIRGYRPYRIYLKHYHDVDIALDTFPGNGGTTTSDAFWMGVPAVSMVSHHQVGRYGLSLLSSIGLESLAANSASEYVAQAVALARNPEALMQMRQSMRARVADSTLCDSTQFACDLESAYREMWRQWCRKQA